MADWSNFYTDYEEYSRYEYDRDQVGVTLIPGDYTPIAGHKVVARLVRDDGYGTVGQSSEIVLAGSEASLSLAIALADCIDDDDYSLVRQGRYHVEVDRKDADGNILGTQVGPDVWASVITVNRLKREWLYGIPLYATEVLAPRAQPALPGVTIDWVSPDHLRGLFELKYTAAVTGPPAVAAKLAWGQNGTEISLPADGTYAIPLGDTYGRDYLQVSVRLVSLPATDNTYPVAIDYMLMTDEQMRRIAANAVRWTTTELHIPVELTLVSTPELKGEGWYDEVAQAQNYYRPGNFNRWLSFKLPYRFVQKVYHLAGYIGATKATDFPTEWIRLRTQDGNVELVPSLQTIVNWFYYATAYQLFYANPHMPGFFHYRALVGFPDLKDENEAVLYVAGNRAAMDIAIQAAEAWSGGKGSYSVGRDGLQETRAFTSPIPWAKRIEEWGRTLVGEEGRRAMRKLENHLVGIRMTVLG